MSSYTMLGDKDTNAAVSDHHGPSKDVKSMECHFQNQQAAAKDTSMECDQQAPAKDVKSMDYHRQVFQSKMAEQTSGKYVSPSDNIMSPCTAKIKALRNKHAAKVKPKSLFAQASTRKLQGESSLGARPIEPRK